MPGVVGSRQRDPYSQAGWLRKTFPDRCWIAVELHRRAAMTHNICVAIAANWSVDRHPLVAAGDVHMHVRERRALQDTVTAIRHGCTIEQAGHRLFPNGERHLRTCDELLAIYPRGAAGRVGTDCGALRVFTEEPEVSLSKRTRDGAHCHGTSAQPDRTWNQAALAPWRTSIDFAPSIEKELGLIQDLGYEHFFLTVHDIVDTPAHKCEPPILCQGRGSAANSIVCYALGVTEVNPEKANLLFERFLSKERDEPPDIDVDFEHERREEVIQYVFKKYGKQRTALAATVITYQVRSAIRDVGKALGLGADLIDRIARSHVYWDEPGSVPQEPRSARTPFEHCGGEALLRLGEFVAAFPAPSLSACRRLRYFRRTDQRTGAHRKRRHAGSAGSFNGTRTIWKNWDC